MLRAAKLYLCAAALPLALCAADPLPARAAKVLAENCTVCHGAALQTSGLDLRTRAAALKGGSRGPAIVPGKGADSRLYRFATGAEQPAMPPGKKLSADQAETLKQWIDSGAEWPGEPVAAPDAKSALARMEERPIAEEERRFWAFVPPVRHTPPAVKNASWVRNPVDAFLLAGMEAHGVQPAPEAGRATLIRRLYLDLLGLPPTPDQVRAFVEDRAPGAWERLVDRALASPHYGERYARHWLDLVRYADSAGFEFDRDRANAWRYRDYVIRAFNGDKPYDRFVREQLAGDEIAPRDPDALIATGFLRHGPEANIKTEQTRMDELDDILATTGGAFLGMTVACARCHNHKFDPIPQKDYYRMQAVFFPTRYADHPLASDGEREEYAAGNKRIDALANPLKKQLAAVEQPHRDRLMAEKKAALPEYIQEALRTPPEKRSEGQRLNAKQVEATLRVTEKEVLAAMPSTDLARWREVRAQLEALDAQRPAPLAAAMGVSEPGQQAPASYFLHHGSTGNKGSLMAPGVLSVAARGEYAFPAPPSDARSSWRRAGFAEWVTSPENPLTARVMVNRIWQHHFGEGIVATPNNFGKSGARPTHPELLDWLATEFVRSNWSVKAMHRLILTSNAYRMSSDDVPANIGKDPNNAWLWRMPRRRLEGEIVRDAILAVAGTLDTKMGGPGVYPYIDPALWSSSSGRKWPGQPDHDPTTWRRSVYIFHKRTIPVPMLEVFDKPDAAGSCARRNRSTIAPQALILMNNAFIGMQARLFAQRLQRDAGSDPGAQVDRAFTLALGRAPSPTERADSLAFLRGGPYGLVDFCQAIFNLNEFVYLP